MTGSPYQAEQKAVIDAVLNLFGASSTAALMLPIPNTKPPLFIVAGETRHISAMIEGAAVRRIREFVESCQESGESISYDALLAEIDDIAAGGVDGERPQV